MFPFIGNALATLEENKTDDISQAFSPTLIAYRVFQGKGWSSETNDLSASIIFSKFSSHMATEPNVNLNVTDSGWTSQPTGTIASVPTMSGSYGTAN